MTAKWRKGTYNKDKTGTEIKEWLIRVTKELSTNRFDSTPTDGVTSHDWTRAIQSDSPKAREIQAGDMIIYQNHRYTVQTTATTPNRLVYNGFDTIIYMK